MSDTNALREVGIVTYVNDEPGDPNPGVVIDIRENDGPALTPAQARALAAELISRAEYAEHVSRETNSVREAIKLVLARWANDVEFGDRPVAPWGQDGELLLDELVAAVEAMPRPTIRDLDMTDSRNIITVRWGVDLAHVLNAVQAAHDKVCDLSLTVDNGALKLKVGGYSWSAPIATEVYEP